MSSKIIFKKNYHLSTRFRSIRVQIHQNHQHHHVQHLVSPNQSISLVQAGLVPTHFLNVLTLPNFM